LGLPVAATAAKAALSVRQTRKRRPLVTPDRVPDDRLAPSLGEPDEAERPPELCSFPLRFGDGVGASLANRDDGDRGALDVEDGVP
jgi:hypothetical protein